MRHPRIAMTAVATGLLVASFVVLQGRYGSGVAQAGGGIGVSAVDFDLTPDRLSAPANTSFTVTLTNNGARSHNFSIQAPGGLQGTGNAAPGGTSSRSYNLPDGTYLFYCTIGNHRQQGMSGTIVIGTGSPPPPDVPPPDVPPPDVPPPDVPPPDVPPAEVPAPPTQPPAGDSTEQAPDTGKLPKQPGSASQASATLNRVKLTGKRPRALRLRSRLVCDSASGPCRLTLTVQARVGARLLATTSKPRKRKVTLAKKRITLAPGTTRTVRTPLTKAGRKVFRNTRRLRGVTLILRGRTDAGPLEQVSRTVRLNLPFGG